MNKENPFNSWLESLWKSLNRNARENFVNYLITDVDFVEDLISYQSVAEQFCEYYDIDKELIK